MNVLVAYASRHGATRGIAERITQVLEDRGVQVELKPADAVGRVDRYDAFVIGSAAYMGHWMAEATKLVRTHRDALARGRVWLFSSGPVGHDTVDDKGRDVVEASRPAEFSEFAESIRPRDERIFFGAFDPDQKPSGLLERLGAPLLRLPAIREALPAGDFRDWPAIASWAEGIADELGGVRAAAAHGASG